MKNLFVLTLAMCCVLQGEAGLPQYWLSLFNRWIPQNSNFMNVMMALDSSTSVGKDNFNYGKKGIKRVNKMIDRQTLTGITGSPLGTRSGFIQFASEPDTVIQIHLNDYNNVDDLNAAIQELTHTDGATAIAKALWLAGKEFLNFSPLPWQKKRVLLVTDGKETEGGDPVAVAQKLKDHGVEICTVAIGNDVNVPILKEIATKYYDIQYMHDTVPCYINPQSWRAFERVMRRSLRLLRKDKRKGSVA